MDFTYKLLQQAMSGSMKRQEVILHNVSNLNTKDYKAKKYEFENQLKQAVEKNNGISTKHPQGHYKAPEINETSGIVEKTEGITGRDANNVDLNSEMIDLTTNQMYYNGLVQQVNKKIALRHYVVTGGR